MNKIDQIVEAVNTILETNSREFGKILALLAEAKVAHKE